MMTVPSGDEGRKGDYPPTKTALLSSAPVEGAICFYLLLELQILDLKEISQALDQVSDYPEEKGRPRLLVTFPRFLPGCPGPLCSPELIFVVHLHSRACRW